MIHVSGGRRTGRTRRVQPGACRRGPARQLSSTAGPAAADHSALADSFASSTMEASHRRGESGMRRALTILGAALVLICGVTAAVALGAGAGSKDSSTSTATSSAAPVKVWLCHHTGSWKRPYHLIHVSSHAVAAHRRHGDVDPGAGNSLPASPAGRNEGARQERRSARDKRKGNRAEVGVNADCGKLTAAKGEKSMKEPNDLGVPEDRGTWIDQNLGEGWAESEPGICPGSPRPKTDSLTPASAWSRWLLTGLKRRRTWAGRCFRGSVTERCAGSSQARPFGLHHKGP